MDTGCNGKSQLKLDNILLSVGVPGLQEYYLALPTEISWHKLSILLNNADDVDHVSFN